MAKNRIIGHINYSKGLRLKNPSEKDSEKQVVAYNQELETIDLALLAEHIKDHGSSYSKGTIFGVLTDMVECIIEQLRGGYGILLDGLGKFGTSLRCSGAESAEEFTAANITGVNLTFTPAEEVKHALNTNMEFEYVGTRKSQAEARKTEQADINSDLGVTPSSGGSGSGSGSGSGDSGDVTP